jgi:3'(2'), 5'-bisphosphate nucleotidase
MTLYAHELTILRDAARRAGKLCLAVRAERLIGSPDAMEKAGKEPVTLADYGAQAVILGTLAAAFPKDGVIAEESSSDLVKLISNADRESLIRHVSATVGRPTSMDTIRGWLDFGRSIQTSRVWTVDPIDGTKGFIRGDQFAVAIALLVDGAPTAAALACPLLPLEPALPDGERGIIALAVRGQGARLEALSGGFGRLMHVSSISEPQRTRALESIEAAHHDHDFAAWVFDKAGVRGKPLRMDSQAKYAAVADGRGEIYLRHSWGNHVEKIWDHAAGVLIVEEAGGKVTDLDGNLLDFSHGARLGSNRGILATNGPIHNALLSTIQNKQ